MDESPDNPRVNSVDHYENFPVASVLCPPALRAPIVAIYHFARTADDLADEGEASADQRLRDLHGYREDLLAAPDAAARSQRWAHIFTPLGEQIRLHALPLAPLLDLLNAFMQDVRKTEDGTGYADEAELLDYCSRSANPIGRLLLHLYGVNDTRALSQSDAICSALQLVNFWQDLSCDIPGGRHYVPDNALARAGLCRAQLQPGHDGNATADLIHGLCAHARALMLSGAPLVHRLPGRAGWELRLVVQGGLRILERIGQGGYRSLTLRPTLRPTDWTVLAWRALWM